MLSKDIIGLAQEAPTAPLAEYMGFRCPKQMFEGLKQYATSHGVDQSAIIRVLIAEGCERHGITIEEQG